MSKDVKELLLILWRLVSFLVLVYCLFTVISNAIYFHGKWFMSMEFLKTNWHYGLISMILILAISTVEDIVDNKIEDTH